MRACRHTDTHRAHAEKHCKAPEAHDSDAPAFFEQSSRAAPPMRHSKCCKTACRYPRCLRQRCTDVLEGANKRRVPGRLTLGTRPCFSALSSSTGALRHCVAYASSCSVMNSFLFESRHTETCPRVVWTKRTSFLVLCHFAFTERMPSFTMS